MLLNELYQNLAPYKTAKRWIVGFSGGMDSTVLLCLLVKLKEQYELPNLMAVHIHHGLQTIADNWPAHCQKICDDLNISLTTLKVIVTKQASIEQAAREARYQAFTDFLQMGDILITAQHKNDQAETLLFRLFRGAGVRGLSAIPKQRSLGAGSVVRPLLNTPYKSLKDYAQNNHIQWIEDPTNQDIHYARNYLRHKIIPIITNYWPQAINTITQASEHLQEAQTLLNVLAEQDLAPAKSLPLYNWLDLPNLLITPLINLSWKQQKNALSFWLTNHTLQPSTQHWQGWFDFINAKVDANPIWRLHTAEIHRGNNRIWLLKDSWLIEPTKMRLPINTFTPLNLPDNGQVKLVGKPPKNLLYVTYRQGGEFISLAKRGNHELKKLFNGEAIPNFLKKRLPILIDQQERLVAVANFPQWFNCEYSKDFTFEWVPPHFSD